MPAHVRRRPFTSVTPRVSSLGVIDQYLSSSHIVATGDGIIDLSHPIVTVCTPRASPLLGVMVGAHCFTWNGSFYACFGFSEELMGSLAEQEILLRSRKSTGTVLEWIDTFMGILASLLILLSVQAIQDLRLS